LRGNSRFVRDYLSQLRIELWFDEDCRHAHIPNIIDQLRQFLCSRFATRASDHDSDDFEIVVLGKVRKRVVESDHFPVLLRNLRHLALRPLIELFDLRDVVISISPIEVLVIRILLG
jgi:hypothetical protein